MRIGLLGGTFDPPHIAHLLIAADAIEGLGLDQLVYVPASQQPLKVGDVVATPAQRLDMTRLLANGDSRLSVDPIEIERPGLSFTVDTLRELARRSPGGGDERFLLMGADVARTFDRWREPDVIRQLAEVVVMRRGREQAPPGFRATPSRRIDVSSTEIRARVRAGRSIRGFVSDAVRTYIEESGLYR
jgi:nicotinate-nucleotide adenylyltransferase